MEHDIELQERVTLDQAVLKGVRTFPNGCNFRLVFCGSKVEIEYGCYGVHVNLVNGTEKLLLDWFTDGDYRKPMGRKLLPIHPRTAVEMKKRHPCGICGGPYFKPISESDANKPFQSDACPRNADSEVSAENGPHR